ncbi:NUDIX hydrolase [Bacillus sp. PS06]|uniref:NUDIX hydrolase n=1 Tax=Bacillus sp. PS06 TaxID=2764176 RepID=UPI00177E71BF|nr:CoA pyrophosphatase [Bacillus sp. PS06]MBD8067415.1 CoA pyrophosphatase [Bacillus sp. PS06]
MRIDSVVSALKNHEPTILGSDNFSKYAILLPLLEVNGETHVLFEVRSKHLRRQPGEICFPGGKVDKKDKTIEYAALRETSEELGVSIECIEQVSPLDYIVSPFGMMVYPYIGVITTPKNILPNPSEVEEVFTVPLSFLLQTEPKIYNIHARIEPEENFPYHLIPGGENYEWRLRSTNEYFYFFEDKVIWGLTARILQHFLEQVK